MANTDKNIVITPNIGSSTDYAEIVFSGADASTDPQNITLRVYPNNGGTLSFEGSSGQLLSIANTMSGTIFSANDVSGIPSIEVLDTGLVKLAQYNGQVIISTSSVSSGAILTVNGDAYINGIVTSTNLNVVGSSVFIGATTFIGPVSYLGSSSTNLVIPGVLSVATNTNLILQNQDGVAYWINTYGDLDFNSANDYGNSVVYDYDGNIIVCVTEQTDANYYTPNVVKYDRSGNLLWKNYINEFGIGAMYGSAEAAVIDSNNNIYLLVTDDTGDVGNNLNNAVNGVWIFQINSDGILINQLNLHPSGIIFNDIAIDSADNIYITGYQGNQLVVASVTFSGITWQTVLDITSGPDLGFSIAVDSSSNVYIGGTGSDISTTALLIKIDNTGAFRWMRGFGDGGGARSIFGIAVDSSGTTYSTIADLANGGVIVVKYDTHGNLLNQVTIDQGSTSPSAIALGRDGYLYLTGNTHNTVPYNVGIWISKLDTDLNNIWTNILVCQNQNNGSPLNQWNFNGHRDISVYNDTFVVTGFTTNQTTTATTATNIPANVITCQLPTDGSYTGVFDNYAYVSASYITTGTSTVVNQTLTPGINTVGSLYTTTTSTAILMEASSLTNYQSTVKSNGTWIFDNDGNLHLPTGGKIYDSQGRLYGTQGSNILTLTPSIIPLMAIPGTFAVADGVYWDPAGKLSNKPYPVFWDGTQWNSLY
jgi:hypothetical protein